MNGLSFAASLITHLYWPLVVVLALVLFRTPLTGLLGRVRKYEGLGQKVEFGERLAEAEETVGQIAQEATVGASAENEPSPLVRQAEANPSFVVIQAWEQLAGTLSEVAKAALKEPKATQWNTSRALNQLVQQEVLPVGFANAANDLRLLRNQVAHGQSNPTPGEAVAYADSAGLLTALLHRTAENLMLARSTSNRLS